MRRQAGFTLIELVSVVVLVGIVAVFGGLFLITGVKGEFAARQAAMAGQKAEMALDRIAIELRDATGGPGAGGAVEVRASAPRIRYTSSLAALAGTRALDYDGTNHLITLTPNTGGTARTLVDNVASCSMTFVANGTASTLTVSFTLTGSSTPYSITIKPRGITVSPVGI